MNNWNCDGSGQNKCCPGEIKYYPTGIGELHGNMLYCRNCFAAENAYNADRARQRNVDPENFKQVKWDTAKVYRDANGDLVD